jgi:hypothetical protein
VLKRFCPYLHVRSVFEIDLESLRRQGIRGIITDLDNTLVGAKTKEAPPELVAWFKLVKSLGFQVVIVSNNRRMRVEQFARPLGIQYIYRAKKPRAHSFKKALNWLGLAEKETVVVGDQLLTDVFGGNRLGLQTIWVKPISLHDESVYTKMNRRIEKWVIRQLRKKGYAMWED